MKIKIINEIAFSPNFSTDKTALAIAEELSLKLGMELKTDKFTTPADRTSERSYNEDELLVIASPTYAGKLPNKILPDFQSKFKGNNTPAVAIVTFGNRLYENSLAELCDTLKANGFNVIAAAAIVNEHVMAHTASGRPSENDITYLKDFADQIADKLLKDDFSAVNVPGDSKAPYYVPKQESGEPAKFLPAKPKTHENCVKCGKCAKGCPMGSIDFTDFSLVSGICIKCHACVNNCPKHAKFFDDEQLLSHIRYLQKTFYTEKTNECYL